MQRLLHPDPEEVQEFMANHIFCPSLQATISQQQCQINQRRARTAGWEDALNIFAYDPCKTCPRATNSVSAKAKARENQQKCNKCGKWVDLKGFDTNPKTKKPYRTCRRCRAVEAKAQTSPDLSGHSDLPLATVTSDASTLLLHKRSVIEFEINKYPFVQFLSSPLRIRPLSERTQSKRVCKLTSKGNSRNPNYTIAIARVARELGIPPGEVYVLKARKDGCLLLRST